MRVKMTYNTWYLAIMKADILREVKMETSYLGAKNLQGSMYDKMRTTDADEEYLDSKVTSAWAEVRLLLSEFERPLTDEDDVTGDMVMKLVTPMTMPAAAVEDMMVAARRLMVLRVTAEWMRNIDMNASNNFTMQCQVEYDRLIHARCQRRRQGGVRMQPF